MPLELIYFVPREDCRHSRTENPSSNLALIDLKGRRGLAVTRANGELKTPARKNLRNQDKTDEDNGSKRVK